MKEHHSPIFYETENTANWLKKAVPENLKKRLNQTFTPNSTAVKSNYVCTVMKKQY